MLLQAHNNHNPMKSIATIILALAAIFPSMANEAKPIFRHIGASKMDKNFNPTKQIRTNVSPKETNKVTPKGDATYYDRLAYGWYIYAGGANLQYGDITGASKIVWGDDNVAWIQNPLTADKHDTYIECTVSGNRLTATFPQVLAMLEDYEGEIPLYISRMKLVESDEGYYYEPCEEGNTVSWIVAEDGSIRLDMPEVKLDDKGKFVNGAPKEILGTYYNYEGPTGVGPVWNAVGDWAQTYTPIQIGEITVIPEGLTLQPWQLTSKRATKTIDIAIDGEDIYIGRLTQYGEGALKGKLVDNKAVFPTRQYLGFNEKQNANVWFLSCNAVYDYYDFGDYVMEYIKSFDRTESLVFDVDLENGKMTTQKNDCYLINATPTETLFFEYQENPCLTYLNPEGMDAAPLDPVFTVVGRDEGDNGVFYQFTLPVTNVNGVTLNTDNLYYNVWVNGELYTFYTDTHSHFTEDLTDIPCNYTDGWDLGIDGDKRGIYFHAQGVQSVDVQSYFIGSGGKVYRSNRVSTQAQPTGSTVFAYAKKTEDNEPSGTGLKETYDVAIDLTNPALEGKQITAIEVPVLPTDKVSGLSVWVADILKIELIDGKNQNVVTRRWDLEMPTKGTEMKYVRCELDRPYTIPKGGTYVGYSLTVNEVSNLHPASLVPIVTALGAKEGGFWLHTSRSFLDWKDRSEDLGVRAMTQVEISGDFMINAVSIAADEELWVAADKENVVNAQAFNLGLDEVESIKYTTSVGDAVKTDVLTFNPPIPVAFASANDISVTLPSVAELGDYQAYIKLDEVNGMPNEADNAKVAINVKVLPFVPKRLPLVEEFTGTWCGWCPRGFVAMEYMDVNYPDFIGIAYHDNDPMAMKGGYPDINSGYPSMAFNRAKITDPYYVKGESRGFTTPEAWEALCKGNIPVGISVEAYKDGENTVKAKAKVEWVLEPEGKDYRVEYVLVADGLTGPGDDFNWWQKNYYSGLAEEPLLEEFCKADDYVPGLVFNDVAILTSGLKGVDGSVQYPVVGVENVSEYVFDLTKALNVGGKKIPYDLNRLRVVAFILDMDTDSEYGVVVNAAKCNVLDESGKAEITVEGKVIETQFFDLQGRMLTAPQQGLNICRKVYDNGTSTTEKIVVK